MRNQSVSQPPYTDNASGVSVHSGFPNPAADASLQGLDLNRLLVNNSASTFMMRIDGNDWADQGIFTGDIALIDRALAPHGSDLVIWWHEDEFAISFLSGVPKGGIVWGVVTTIIHRFTTKEAAG